MRSGWLRQIKLHGWFTILLLWAEPPLGPAHPHVLHTLMALGSEQPCLLHQQSVSPTAQSPSSHPWPAVVRVMGVEPGPWMVVHLPIHAPPTIRGDMVKLPPCNRSPPVQVRVRRSLKIMASKVSVVVAIVTVTLSVSSRVSTVVVTPNSGVARAGQSLVARTKPSKVSLMSAHCAGTGWRHTKHSLIPALDSDIGTGTQPTSGTAGEILIHSLWSAPCPAQLLLLLRGNPCSFGCRLALAGSEAGVVS